MVDEKILEENKKINKEGVTMETKEKKKNIIVAENVKLILESTIENVEEFIEA